MAVDVLNIKDWLVVFENKQFMWVDGKIRVCRLKDNKHYEVGAGVLIKGVGGIWIIVKFQDDCIHVLTRKIEDPILCNIEINEFALTCVGRNSWS